MHSNTKGSIDVAGHYVLTSHEALGGHFVASSYPTLVALARAVASLPRTNGYLCGYGSWYGHKNVAERHVNVRAFSPRGKELALDELAAFADRLARAYRPAWWARELPGYVRRCGPVPGVHKRRGKGFRRFAHMNERRSAALVLPEEGEVLPRAKRQVNSLADPWDHECYACQERSWKAQHKGRKAWDRTRR